MALAAQFFQRGKTDQRAYDGVDTLTGTPTFSNSVQTFSVVGNLSDGFDSVSQIITIRLEAATSTPVTPEPDPEPVSSTGSSGGALGWLTLVLSSFALIKIVIRTRQVANK